MYIGQDLDDEFANQVSFFYPRRYRNGVPVQLKQTTARGGRGLPSRHYRVDLRVINTTKQGGGQVGKRERHSYRKVGENVFLA